MKDFLTDDKNLVILAVTVLGIGIMFIPEIKPSSESLLGNIITGLFGIAVGRGLSTNEQITTNKEDENDDVKQKTV